MLYWKSTHGVFDRIIIILLAFLLMDFAWAETVKLRLERRQFALPKLDTLTGQIRKCHFWVAAQTPTGFAITFIMQIDIGQKRYLFNEQTCAFHHFILFVGRKKKCVESCWSSFRHVLINSMHVLAPFVKREKEKKLDQITRGIEFIGGRKRRDRFFL